MNKDNVESYPFHGDFILFSYYLNNLYIMQLVRGFHIESMVNLIITVQTV